MEAVTTPPASDNEGISPFAIGTILLRSRRRLALWALAGALIAGIPVINKQQQFRASASFVPQGGDVSRSGLASLAGQLGVSVPTGNQAGSPDFYSKLLKSRVLLLPIVRDTFVIAEKGNVRKPFLDFIGVRPGPRAKREEDGVTTLKGMVNVSIDRNTSVLEVSVVSDYRSVSLAIVSKLVDGVNQYNQKSRQEQAVAEANFIEGRMEVAQEELRSAEFRMEQFLRTNRELGGSPELALERERLQRDLELRQEVLSSLTKAYEELRIREVRDTPVITVFEPPAASMIPEPRGRIARIVLGMLLFTVLGAMVTFISYVLKRKRREGDPEVSEFVAALEEVGRVALAPIRKMRRGSKQAPPAPSTPAATARRI